MWLHTAMPSTCHDVSAARLARTHDHGAGPKDNQPARVRGAEAVTALGMRLLRLWRARRRCIMHRCWERRRRRRAEATATAMATRHSEACRLFSSVQSVPPLGAGANARASLTATQLPTATHRAGHRPSPRALAAAAPLAVESVVHRARSRSRRCRQPGEHPMSRPFAAPRPRTHPPAFTKLQHRIRSRQVL